MDGVELSREMLTRTNDQAQKRGLSERLKLHHGGVDRLPFDDAQFDVVCSVHTVYFWSDLANGMAEIARVCKPGAALVLGFSDSKALSEAGWVNQGFRTYPLEHMKRAYEEAGFVVDSCSRAPRPGGGEYYALRGVRIA